MAGRGSGDAAAMPAHDARQGRQTAPGAARRDSAGVGKVAHQFAFGLAYNATRCTRLDYVGYGGCRAGNSMGRRREVNLQSALDAGMRRSYLDTARRIFQCDFYPEQHYSIQIDSGMISGTICDGDADCSDATGADSAPAAAADDDDGGDPDPEPERRRQHPPHPQALAPTPARAPERGTVTATAGDPSSPPLDPASELWRLPAVLAHVPISRSSWFAGVKAGRYPKPVRLSERLVVWRASDIRSFVAAL